MIKFTIGNDHCNNRTILTAHGKNGMRNFDVRLRNGLWELWTGNRSINEAWNFVNRTSQKDILPYAEYELYGWAQKQNWDDYVPEQETRA